MCLTKHHAIVNQLEPVYSYTIVYRVVLVNRHNLGTIGYQCAIVYRIHKYFLSMISIISDVSGGSQSDFSMGNFFTKNHLIRRLCTYYYKTRSWLNDNRHDQGDSPCCTRQCGHTRIELILFQRRQRGMGGVTVLLQLYIVTKPHTSLGFKEYRLKVLPSNNR